MAIATARGFEGDEGYSPREMAAGLNDAAVYANNGIPPEEVTVDPVPREKPLGGVALGVYRPSGQEGVSAATYRALPTAVMTGRLLVSRQMPVIIRGDGLDMRREPPIQPRFFGQAP